MKLLKKSKLFHQDIHKKHINVTIHIVTYKKLTGMMKKSSV